MYNFAMKGTKEIHFSQARQQLSSIVDEVQRTGKPIKILRHGKVAAVVIGPEAYRQKFEKKEWKLAGSIIPVKGVDLEKELQKLSQEHAEAWRRRMERRARELSED
jgi:prevent-host-death family protein